MPSPTLYKISTVVGLSLLTALSHAQIYKSVTPDGQVVYTDNANTAFEVGKSSNNFMVLDKLATVQATQSATTSTSPSANATSLTASPQVNGDTSPTATSSDNTSTIRSSETGDYRLTIIHPEPEMAYRRVTQTIDVEVATSPALKTGDRFVYSINGKHIATTADNQIKIATDQYNPGEYQLTVKIENIKGDIIATAERPFYILSNNFAIQKQRKALAKAKADYEKLPWYKKMKINITL